MRIVVHGQQAFGKAVLEALLKRGENVVAVYVAPEKEGAKADPLKEAALAAKLPVYQPASYKDPKVWEEFRALKPDLQVMAFVTLFVPEEFLNIPTHGSIQYHPSLLPAYRGASAINWPIIKGEKETGLSIFWPDNGLDTGDVLMQKKTPISDTDTLGTVYFDRLFPMGVEAMLEGVDLVKAGKAPRIKQDERKATYEGRCGPDNARIDWGKPWEQIDRLIRGCNPAPGAWATLDGKTAEDFRRQAAAGEGPQGHRRQDRRDRRDRRRRASRSCAPTAASRSRACSPPMARRSAPANGPKSASPRRARFSLTLTSHVMPGLARAHPRTSEHLSRLDSSRASAGMTNSESSLAYRKPPMPASQHQIPKSDIEISQAAKKRRIVDVAKEKLGIAAENLEPYGHYKAKVSMDYIKSLEGQEERQADPRHGDLADAGGRRQDHDHGRPHRRAQPHRQEGDAARCASRRSGPCFGMKGGAAGGGYAQVIPMEDINLHFTGDFHAITSAHNLLSALIDNHIYWGNALGIDSRRVVWRRVMDMNDRALREIVCSLGGVANGFPREAGFDITVASEVMAIFCLAKDLEDLKERLGNIIVGLHARA